MTVFGSMYRSHSTVVYGTPPKGMEGFYEGEEDGDYGDDEGDYDYDPSSDAMNAPSPEDEEEEEEEEGDMSCEDAAAMYAEEYPESQDFPGGPWEHYLANYKIPGNDYVWRGAGCGDFEEEEEEE